jgi:tetratricopeptide (TPR) repeat protein
MDDQQWESFCSGQLRMEITNHMEPSPVGITAYADQLMKLGVDWKPVFKMAVRLRAKMGAPLADSVEQELLQEVEQKLAQSQGELRELPAPPPCAICHLIHAEGHGCERPAFRGVTNPFALLGITALASTAELRRIAEKARVQRAMAAGSKDAVASDLAERLLQDPVYRLREAAAWYFECSSIDEARSKGGALQAHDDALRLWHRETHPSASEPFSTERWARACARTTEVLNNPPSWLGPLEKLIQEIGDARLNKSSIPAAANAAAASWITSALLALAEHRLVGYVRRASRLVAKAQFSQEVMNQVSELVLRRCTSEIGGLYSSTKPRADGLINAIREDASLNGELAALGQALAEGARRWVTLYRAFDAASDVTDEARVLDDAAQLARNIAIAIHNHSTLAEEALRLIEFAALMARTRSLKDHFLEDAQVIRGTYLLQADDDVRRLLSIGNLQEAEALADTMADDASTDDERDGVANLIRGISVSVYNEGGQAERALEILERACEIAASSERRLELQQETHELRALAVGALVDDARSRTEPVTNKLKGNTATSRSVRVGTPQLIPQLESEVQKLLHVVDPWRQRILAETPSDSETRSLDGVAVFVRNIAVDVFNNTTDPEAALRLLKAAAPMALSTATTSSIAEDLRRVIYLAARDGTVAALQRGDISGAGQRAVGATEAATTAEDKVEMARLNLAVDAAFVKRAPLGYESAPDRKVLLGCKECGKPELPERQRLLNIKFNNKPPYEIVSWPAPRRHLLLKAKVWKSALPAFRRALWGNRIPANDGYLLCCGCGSGRSLGAEEYRRILAEATDWPG